jgi:hypothetical protein
VDCSTKENSPNEFAGNVAADAFRSTASQSVGHSSLFAGEYDNSTVHVRTQSVMLIYSLQF